MKTAINRKSCRFRYTQERLLIRVRASWASASVHRSRSTSGRMPAPVLKRSPVSACARRIVPVSSRQSFSRRTAPFGVEAHSLDEREAKSNGPAVASALRQVRVNPLLVGSKLGDPEGPDLPRRRPVAFESGAGPGLSILGRASPRAKKYRLLKYCGCLRRTFARQPALRHHTLAELDLDAVAGHRRYGRLRCRHLCAP